MLKKALCLLSILCATGAFVFGCSDDDKKDDSCTTNACFDNTTLMVCQDGRPSMQVCPNGCANDACVQKQPEQGNPGDGGGSGTGNGGTGTGNGGSGTGNGGSGTGNGDSESLDDILTDTGKTCDYETYGESCDGKVVQFCDDPMASGKDTIHRLDCGKFGAEVRCVVVKDFWDDGVDGADCYSDADLCEDAEEYDETEDEDGNYYVCLTAADGKKYWVFDY